MTTDHLTSPSGPVTPGAQAEPSPAAPSSDRLRVAAVALGLSALAVATVLVWRPWGERDAFGYDDLAPLRDNAWVGTLVDGFAFGVLAVTLSVVTCFLVQARGRHAATVGAVATIAGGLLFAMGSLAHGAVAWFATSDVVSVQAGTALLEHVEDEPLRVMGPVMAGFLLVAVGMLVLAAALLRARSVPRWLPIALIVGTLAQFAPVSSRGLDVIQVVLMAVIVCLSAAAIGRSRT